MNQLALIFLFVICLSTKSQAQVHWLINKDSSANCNLLRIGKFVNKETDSKATKGYTIEFTENEIIEKIDDGKYFVKSKVIFTSPCNYILTILETTAEQYKTLIGTNINVEIVETATIDNLVKIRSKHNGEWQNFVLEKIID